jgi:aspartyl-tRNA(Asn)/glutamyl-tRNA(Gln) amidotransferase subunit A
MKSLIGLARDLAHGRTTSRALVEAALARIDDPKGEGKTAFTKVYRDAALAAADASDSLRKAGVVASPLAGIPVSIKDLADVAGETTLAGSVALKGQPPAAADAPVVARLRAAGAVIIGRTNMTEFAMGGLGLNPHYGTPRNPWDRATGRIPGGSSSGAAVSVTDGMAAAALGTDTAGSVRIPSAFCGLVGFKPTARRVPIDGILPLAVSLDSVGPLAATVTCCALVDSVFAGEPPFAPAPMPLAGLRLAVPQTLVLDDLDPEVAAAFSTALSKLSAAGARISEIPFAELAELAHINRQGGITAAEAYAWHRRHLEAVGGQYDPIIAGRMRRGADISAADYIDLQHTRTAMIERGAAVTADYDALVMPTLPIVARPIASVTDVDTWLKLNATIIRNTYVANFFDRCAITVPCHKPGEAPVGFNIMGETGGDRRLLSIALAVEAVLCPDPSSHRDEMI